MATKLHGYINLSKIPKELITTNRAGDRVLWIDVIERRSEGKYGETHSITCYDNRTRETTYLSDLTPQNFGGNDNAATGGNGGNARIFPDPQPAHAPQDDPNDDLPF